LFTSTRVYFFFHYIVVILYDVDGGLAQSNVLISISVLAVRRARLIVGWVTVCGRVHHLSICIN